VGKHPTDRGKIGTKRSVLTDGGGVPIGLAVEGANRNDFIDLTIYDKPFQEDLILRIGYTFEQASDWHRRTPDLSWVHG
jgi:hypothetical protein